MRGATRGDGVRGEDVTSNVRTIRAIPLAAAQATVAGPASRCAARSTCRARRSNASTASARRRASRSSPNPRNAAAGTLRNLDPALVAKRGLSAFFYQLVGGPEGPPLRSRNVRRTFRSAWTPTRETLEQLRAWGLPVEPHWRRCAGIDALVAFCDEWAEKRRTLDFDTDGVVIKVDALAQRARARHHQQVPALGGRVQVPGGAEDDAAAAGSR